MQPFISTAISHHPVLPGREDKPLVSEQEVIDKYFSGTEPVINGRQQKGITGLGKLDSLGKHKRRSWEKNTVIMENAVNRKKIKQYTAMVDEEQNLDF